MQTHRITRVLGWLLLAAALLLAGADGLASLEAGAWRLAAFGDIWFRLHPFSLNLAQAVVQRHLHPALWDPAAIAVLRLPAGPALGVTGIALLLLARRLQRRRRRLFS